MRPYKLTPVVWGRIVEALERGESYARAAREGGVIPRTLHQWLRVGRAADTGELADFARQCDEARLRAARPSPERGLAVVDCELSMVHGLRILHVYYEDKAS